MHNEVHGCSGWRQLLNCLLGVAHSLVAMCFLLSSSHPNMVNSGSKKQDVNAKPEALKPNATNQRVTSLWLRPHSLSTVQTRVLAPFEKLCAATQKLYLKQKRGCAECRSSLTANFLKLARIIVFILKISTAVWMDDGWMNEWMEDRDSQWRWSHLSRWTKLKGANVCVWNDGWWHTLQLNHNVN